MPYWSARAASAPRVAQGGAGPVACSLKLSRWCSRRRSRRAGCTGVADIARDRRALQRAGGRVERSPVRLALGAEGERIVFDIDDLRLERAGLTDGCGKRGLVLDVGRFARVGSGRWKRTGAAAPRLAAAYRNGRRGSAAFAAAASPSSAARDKRQTDERAKREAGPQGPGETCSPSSSDHPVSKHPHARAAQASSV